MEQYVYGKGTKNDPIFVISICSLKYWQVAVLFSPPPGVSAIGENKVLGLSLKVSPN